MKSIAESTQDYITFSLQSNYARVENCTRPCLSDEVVQTAGWLLCSYMPHMNLTNEGNAPGFKSNTLKAQKHCLCMQFACSSFLPTHKYQDRGWGFELILVCKLLSDHRFVIPWYIMVIVPIKGDLTHTVLQLTLRLTPVYQIIEASTTACAGELITGEWGVLVSTFSLDWCQLKPPAEQLKSDWWRVMQDSPGFGRIGLIKRLSCCWCVKSCWIKMSVWHSWSSSSVSSSGESCCSYLLPRITMDNVTSLLTSTSITKKLDL